MPTTPTFYSILSFAIAATSAIALSPLCFRVAVRIGAVDVPTDERRMHTKATPRAGGLAVFAAVLLSAALLGRGEREYVPLLVGGLVTVAMGIMDDVYRISPWQKLGMQAIASALAVSALPSGRVAEGGMCAVGAWLWIILLTNAFNLVDGLDGLCTRVAIFSALGLFAMDASPLALALAGALSGFLPFNLRPARMFLGDTGSLFVGFALGILSAERLFAPMGEGAIPVLTVFALPLADTAFAFLRRLAKGKSPFSPDRGHFHHRLVDSGFSHREASLLLSLVALALASIGAALGG